MNASRFAVTLVLFTSTVSLARSQEAKEGPDARPLLDTRGTLPERAVARLGTQGWHHPGLTRVHFVSPRELVSLGADQTVRYWSIPDGVEVAQFKHKDLQGHASARDELMELMRGEVLMRGRRIRADFLHLDGMDMLANRTPLFSPKIGRLIHARLGKIMSLDVRGKEPAETLDVKGQPLALSADGNTLALYQTDGEEGAVATLYDLASRKVLKKLRLPGRRDIVFRGGMGGLHGMGTPVSMVFSPDGRYLGGVAGGTGLVWDLKSGKRIRTYMDRERNVHSLQFSPNGQQVLTVSDMRSITVWEIDSEDEVAHIRLERTSALSACFGPTEKTVLILGDDCNLTWWDVTGPKEIRRWELAEPAPSDMELSPDGKKLVFRSHTGRIRLFDLETGKEPNAPRLGPIRDLAFVGSQSLVLATSSGQAYQAQWSSGVIERQQTKMVAAGMAVAAARIIDLPKGDGTVVADLFTHKELYTPSPQEALSSAPCFSRDGLRVAMHVTGATSEVQIVRLADGKTIARYGWPGTIACMAFSADEKVLAGYNGPERSIELFELASGQVRRVIPHRESGMERMLFSANGRLLLGLGDDRLIRVWDAWTGKLHHRLAGHGGSVTGMAVSPREPLLVSTDSEGTAILWDLTTGKEKFRCNGHGEAITAVDFAANGRYFATGSVDQTVLVWDVQASARPVPPDAARSLEALWKDLGDVNAEVAGEAMAKLMEQPDAAVALLRKHVQPAPQSQEEEIQKLIAQLDDARYAVREKARVELEKLETATEGYLHKALTTMPNLEKEKRLQHLILRLQGPVRQSEVVRALRALEILDHINTPAALEVLTELSRGASGARLTRQAQEILHRRKS